MAIPFLSNIDLNKNQLLNHTLHNATSNPSSPSEGQIYYNTSTDKVLVYNGSAWISIAGDITAVTSATTNQLTVANENGPAPAFSIVTGAVANGGTALATGDQIYDFVIGQNYSTTTGTVTSVTSGNANTITIGGTAAAPTVAANTAAVTNGSTNLSTGDQIYDFVVGYADASGTDNSTNVTLAGSLDYITISGQVITRNAIDLATDVTGTLPIAKGGTGQTTAAAAANALLNVSQGGALAIGDTSDTITIAGNLIVTGDTKYSNETIQIVTDNTLAFRAGDGNAHEILLTAADATGSDKTITLPNTTGTVALTSDINDGTLTVQGNNGLTGSGTFTANDSDSPTITLSHADTSSQASVNNSGVTVIQDITLDTYGHVSVLGSVDLTSGINSLIDTKISATGYAATITDTATITHSLGTDVIIQLYDITTGETVYADVDRINSTQATITFASTPTNSIRVLVQQIN
jgi:hypothetical protein